METCASSPLVHEASNSRLGREKSIAYVSADVSRESETSAALAYLQLHALCPTVNVFVSQSESAALCPGRLFPELPYTDLAAWPGVALSRAHGRWN